MLAWHHRNSREMTITLFAPLVRKELAHLYTPDIQRQSQAKCAKIMDTFESILRVGGTKYLVGNNPTLADIVVYGDVGQCQDKYCGLFDFSSYPLTRKWLSAVEALPKFDEAHQGLAPVAGYIKSKMSKMAKL
eukprot:m.132807 g.132807  ORF g.132807 m.132807 type:complete len:133 (+) comp17511_c0_seq2:349-747(+)